MSTNSSPKYFLVDKAAGQYSEIQNPQFWKYTRNGKRVPYTAADLTNASIQPYDTYDYELMIKPMPNRPGYYIVSQLKTQRNENENNNAVNVTNILGNYPGDIDEQIAVIKHKYKIRGAYGTQSMSMISYKQQVMADIEFLFNFYISMAKFYKEKVIGSKGQNAFENAIQRKQSYLNIFRNDPKSLQEFNEYLQIPLNQLADVARRYPILQLSNYKIFSNPQLFYKKISELKTDFDRYYALKNQYEANSKKIFSQINTRLKTMKRSRRNNNNKNNNNNNNYEPAPKRFTLQAPPRGGTRRRLY